VSGGAVGEWVGSGGAVGEWEGTGGGVGGEWEGSSGGGVGGEWEGSGGVFRRWWRVAVSGKVVVQESG
jgi:hypothetical protein